MKGGARVSAGRPADPNALRPNAGRGKEEWLDLPAVGRQGDAPEWPLASPRQRELEVWGREWLRPQAVVWEANGQETEVALYVRALVDAEDSRASVAARTLVRQLMDSLGITAPGMRNLRWRIVAEPEKQQRATGTAGRASARERLKLVEGA